MFAGLFYAAAFAATIGIALIRALYTLLIKGLRRHKTHAVKPRKTIELEVRKRPSSRFNVFKISRDVPSGSNRQSPHWRIPTATRVILILAFWTVGFFVALFLGPLPWAITVLLMLAHAVYAIVRTVKKLLNKTSISEDKEPVQHQPVPGVSDIPDDIAASLETYVETARNESNESSNRISAYREAFRIIDSLRSQLFEHEQHGIDIIEEHLTAEYRYVMSQMEQNLSSNIVFGPSLDIETAADARRNGIQGAQWSAANDACPLCQSLDGKTISIAHPDFNRFIPPLHDGCQCFRVYVGAGQTNFEPDWVTPSDDLLHEHAPHLLK